MEHFYTLQGEGFWTGTAAYFIRLGGCDVGCHWCDVKESWEEAAHPRMSVTELVSLVTAAGAKRVVITGGEPLLHSLDALCAALHEKQLLVHIETSGSSPLSGVFDWFCLSPKKFKPASEEAFLRADELKVIVHNRHDLKWAEEQARKCPERTILFLQPEWFQPESTTWILEYVKLHPHWRLSLQTHKFLQIP